MIKDKIILNAHKKLDFLIWKYGDVITECPEPQQLLSCFQRDLDELKKILNVEDYIW